MRSQNAVFVEMMASRNFPFPYNGMDVKVCVASGLANARTVMERVKER